MASMPVFQTGGESSSLSVRTKLSIRIIARCSKPLTWVRFPARVPGGIVIKVSTLSLQDRRFGAVPNVSTTRAVRQADKSPPSQGGVSSSNLLRRTTRARSSEAERSPLKRVVEVSKSSEPSISSLRLMARILGFHPGEAGSKPAGMTKNLTFYTQCANFKKL